MTRPEIWILRHGQTEWNAAGRIQGQKNSDLTDLGKAQAQVQNELLKAANLPDNVSYWCSPLGRCRQTAALALADLCAEPQLDDRLMEVSAGAFEGLSLEEVGQSHPHLLEADLVPSWHYHAPGGESFDTFRARIQSWLDDLTGPTVVVTHGMVSREMRGLLLGLDAEAASHLPGGQGLLYHVANGKMSKIEA